jgi:hypothetical protein
MFDQMFTDWERAAEASRQMQQEMFTQWTQPLLSAMSNAGIGAEGRALQKRWMEFMVDTLNRQRESIDATYQAGVELIEHALRSSETTSPEDYHQITEDLWRRMMDSYKNQSEAQVREFQKWAEKFLEMAQKKPSKRRAAS